MENSKIHIYEENINLFWAVVGLITVAAGAYFLADAFFAGSWQWMGFQQISSLILFGIGFYAIIQLVEPLYHFILFMDDTVLNVEIWQGSENQLETKKIPIHHINEVKIIPHTPRGENEALFDFASNYHLLYRTHKEEVYDDLIALNNQSFTLKLKDIQKVIQFIQKYNHKINIKDDQLIYR